MDVLYCLAVILDCELFQKCYCKTGVLSIVHCRQLGIVLSVLVSAVILVKMLYIYNRC